MDYSDVLFVLCQAVAETFGIHSEEVTAATKAEDVDGWDSLTHATLVIRLERIFDVGIPARDASAAQSVGDLAQLIAKLKQAGVQRKHDDSVFVGTDGRTLFHRDHDAVEQIVGEIQFITSELNRWVSCIETRHAWCAARGIAYVHLVVPEKHLVYEDLLPEYVKPAADRAVARLFDGVSGPARMSLLYPLTLLRERRSVRETYYANDTHWTMYGGFLAYQEMMRLAERHLPVRAIDEDTIRYVRKRHAGDLGARMTPAWFIDEVFTEHKKFVPHKILYENRRFGYGGLTVYRGPNQTAPRALILRDSFSNYIIPHMIPVFSRLTAVASPHMMYDLILAEKPDIVFFEVVERFLAYKLSDGGKAMPEDLAGLDTAAYIGISPKELADIS